MATIFYRKFIGKGASGAVVEPGVEADLPLIEVTDTLAGLGELAAYWRKSFFNTHCCRNRQ